MHIATSPTLTAGPPDVSGPLAVFPLFGPPPRLEYISYAEGVALGVKVGELPSGPSPGAVLVHNPLPLPVLLYEGEELIGAQQNRTVDAAVLVPAGADLEIAVSCVEAGRWDGARAAEAFTPSPQAAHPALRAAKSRSMRGRMAAGLPAQADQAEVWQMVDAAVERVAAPSQTRAMSDAFDHRRGDLDAMCAAVERRDGQVGALVAIGGRFVVLDAVSRADVFAALHGPLVRGYGLDALARSGGSAPSVEEAGVLLATIAGAPKTGAAAGGGLGRPMHFESGRLAGTGLDVDGELVQLSAHVGDADSPSAHRIRRPSRRG